MKNLFFVIVMLCGVVTSSAQNLNNYKYIIVPESFEFSKGENQYQLNALTKFLFEKYGFQVFMKDETKPSDLRNNNCLALRADVKDDSGLFVTRMKVVLEDCNGKIVFESEEGSSRKKDYKTARHESLREAFMSFEGVNYEYAALEETTETAEEEKEATPEVLVVAVDIPGKEVKEKEEVSPKQVDKSKTNTTSLEKMFLREGMSYYLKENPKGFSFFQKGMAEPFAVLIKSEGSNSYIYNSITKQGMAYFNEAGDLVVEYFNRNENKLIKIIYQLED